MPVVLKFPSVPPRVVPSAVSTASTVASPGHEVLETASDSARWPLMRATSSNWAPAELKKIARTGWAA
jgi:hypothetical protein